LCKYLAEKGYNITVFDSHKPSDRNEWILLIDEIIIGDIRDESAISRLAQKDFDIAIHLISLDHYKSEDDPNFVSSINVMPTWNLLDCLTKNGLKKFIYFSTIQVYGNLSGGVVIEDQIPKPLNNYGLTHLLSENICNYYNEKSETECINVRLSNTYGSPIFEENNCWWLVINDLCKAAIENNQIRLKSDGSPQRDFIHGNDVARAIDILINYNNITHNVFHIASEKTLTILELAHRVKSAYTKIYNKDIDIILPDNSLSKHLDLGSLKGIDRYIISASRLRDLGFKEELNLELGIKEIFHYLDIGTV